MKKMILTAIASIAIFANVLLMPSQAQVSPDEDFLGGPPTEMESGFPPPGESGGKKSEMRGKKGSGHFLQMLKDLNLTDEQKQKLKDQRTNAKSQMMSLKKQLMTEHKKMATLMFSPSSSKSELLAQHQKIMSIQNQLGTLRINNISAFKDILTPEQKAKLQKISAEKLKQFESKRKQFGNKRQNKSEN